MCSEAGIIATGNKAQQLRISQKHISKHTAEAEYITVAKDVPSSCHDGLLLLLGD
jgi:hypothetical protein